MQVVPGLTSPLAVPALAGVAVTERGLATSVTIASGLAKDTPVAVIERGATPEERRISTTLGALGAVEIAAPAALLDAVRSGVMEPPQGSSVPGPTIAG